MGDEGESNESSSNIQRTEWVNDKWGWLEILNHMQFEKIEQKSRPFYRKAMDGERPSFQRTGNSVVEAPVIDSNGLQKQLKTTRQGILLSICSNYDEKMLINRW